MEGAVAEPYFVPETLMADTLFRNMRKEKEGLAVVLDEYGGMSGIVTLKDLIEELVGDLEDDIVEEEPDDFIEKIGANVWKIAGGASLEEVSEALEVSLPCEEYDTLNGLIFHTLESLPEEKDEIEIDSLKIKVVNIENYQVQVAIVRKIKSEPAEIEE